MKRAIGFFLAGGILGSIFGLALGVFLFPYVFPPAPANETLTAAERTEIVSSGTFIHADPNDPIHYGEGSVTVYRNTIFLEPDFKVGPGPDYHVYLVDDAAIRTSDAVKNANHLDLGQLRSFEGSQKYDIPAGTDLSAYPSVVIWCQQFGVLISPADLNSGS